MQIGRKIGYLALSPHVQPWWRAADKECETLQPSFYPQAEPKKEVLTQSANNDKCKNNDCFIIQWIYQFIMNE